MFWQMVVDEVITWFQSRYDIYAIFKKHTIKFQQECKISWFHMCHNLLPSKDNVVCEWRIT